MSTESLKTLYKRTKTGAIQQWTIKVHNYGTGALIEKQAGQLGGKLTTHEEDVKVGKNIGKANETTPYEQALSQALSDWRKKHDEGYKSLEELGISVIGDQSVSENSVYSYGFSSAAYTLKDVLEITLPKFNTDASGNVKPMLAPSKPWKYGDKKNKYPMLADIKKDGLRATIVMTPEGTKILSRSGKEYTTMYRIINYLDARFPISDRFRTTILDGELYYHGLLLEEINEAVKKENHSTYLIQFHMFDVVSFDQNQEDRLNFIEAFVEQMKSGYFKFDRPVIVNSDQEVLELHDKHVENDYEGLILKDPKGYYEPGQRSNYWRKVKMFDDNEFMIVGYKLGLRGAQDLAFTCSCNHGKDTFDAPMNGSVALKEMIVSNIDGYMGKDLTVKHFGFSKYNIPNLPKGKAIREKGS